MPTIPSAFSSVSEIDYCLASELDITFGERFDIALATITYHLDGGTKIHRLLVRDLPAGRDRSGQLSERRHAVSPPVGSLLGASREAPSRGKVEVTKP